MKKFLPKSLAAVLALLLLAASLPLGVSADGAKEPQKGKQLTDKKIADLLGEDLTKGSDLIKYEDYLEENGEKEEGEGVAEYTASLTVKTKPVSFKVDIPETGYYNLGFSYKALSRETIMFSMGVDGKIPFAEAEKLTLYGIYNAAQAVTGKEFEVYKNLVIT